VVESLSALTLSGILVVESLSALTLSVPMSFMNLAELKLNNRLREKNWLLVITVGRCEFKHCVNSGNNTICHRSYCLYSNYVIVSAIGNAFATLSDKEKRRRYDLYGEEEARQPSRSHSHHNGFEAEVSPEELFNMFFGGAGFTTCKSEKSSKPG